MDVVLATNLVGTMQLTRILLKVWSDTRRTLSPLSLTLQLTTTFLQVQHNTKKDFHPALFNCLAHDKIAEILTQRQDSIPLYFLWPFRLTKKDLQVGQKIRLFSVLLLRTSSSQEVKNILTQNQFDFCSAYFMPWACSRRSVHCPDWLPSHYHELCGSFEVIKAPCALPRLKLIHPSF